MASTIIITSCAGVPNPFLKDEQSGIDNVTVFVGWNVQDGVLDGLIVVPQAIKSLTGSTNVVLAIQYNVLYNVSVIISLCEQKSTRTFILNYGEVTFCSSYH